MDLFSSMFFLFFFFFSSSFSVADAVESENKRPFVLIVEQRRRDSRARRDTNDARNGSVALRADIFLFTSNTVSRFIMKCFLFSHKNFTKKKSSKSVYCSLFARALSPPPTMNTPTRRRRYRSRCLLFRCETCTIAPPRTASGTRPPGGGGDDEDSFLRSRRCRRG